MVTGVAVAALVTAGCTDDSSDDGAAGDVTDEAASETTLTEAVPAEPIEGVGVPFYVLDTAIPRALTCGSAEPGFDVEFFDESGGSTVVEARVEHDAVTDEVVNATCTDELVDGEPALYYAAVLDAPIAETYESIRLRYPFMPETVFEMVTRVEAETGFYVEVTREGVSPLEPSELEVLLAG